VVTPAALLRKAKQRGRKVRAPEDSVMGNAHPSMMSRGGLEPQRRAQPLRARAGVKRGNLYAEQGGIGDERLSGAPKVSGKLLEPRR